jgi:hypothetical protein
MSTVLDTRYRINGLIDTKQPVLSNLERLCNACGCWLTYDTHAGKFAVVINNSTGSLYSFDDSNIIGSIKVSTSSLDRLYNTVKVVYPHEDLKGELDFIQISVPQVDRFANEFENVLNLNYGVVTNPVQAQLLAFIELKQSRVDKIIQFQTDYSKIGVKAGDVIAVSNDIYDFTAKKFRVITVGEVDGDDGSILIDIIALEYDEEVYSEDMSRYARSDSNGITPLASLPQPTKPTIVKFEANAKPKITATTTLTGGLVEAVEFWSSTDGGSVYTLLKTANPTGNVFPLSSNIVITDDTVASGNLIIKARATNQDGVSLFSTPSDAITYTPYQIPNGISQSTDIVDPSTGLPLVSTAGLALLLKLLNTFLGNGSVAMNTVVGQTIADPAIITSQLLPQGFMISATSGSFNDPAIPHGSFWTTLTTVTFTAPFTGNYSGYVIADQNASSAQGATGDTVAVAVKLIRVSDSAVLVDETSGGTGTRYWNDWVLSMSTALTQGVSYRLEFEATNDTSSGTSVADITFNWNLFTIKT